MYKALINIGEFKKGDEIPADKAELWISMYKISPVEKIGQEDKPFIEEEKSEEMPVNGGNILEDYLARNTKVVKKNLMEDVLSESQLSELLSLEKSGKDRKAIISTIEFKLKSFD